MQYEEAKKIVLATMKDVAINSAYELTNAFVFVVRKKTSPITATTGAAGILVSKKTKEVVAVMPGDPRLKEDIIRFIDEDEGGSDE